MQKLLRLINLCLTKNIPFVTYRLPQTDEIITWVQISGQFNYVEHFNEVSRKEGFVYAPFHRRTNYPIAFFEPERIFINDDIDEILLDQIALLEKMYPDDKLDIPFEIGKGEYYELAGKFIGMFNEKFTKSVLSRVKIANKPGSFDPGKFFIKLAKSYPKAFCHLINLPGAGTWSGASPETLIREDEEYIQTVSLAGTQKKPEDGELINWSEKELNEQQIVTDHIISVFMQFQINRFEKEKTYNLDAGNAVHLATKFKFSKLMIAGHYADFLQALHPTPAVCGFPKDKALDHIIETEKHNREYYSGYCGPLNFLNSSDLFVNLRCMKILPEKLALFVGGGLTKHSNPENEWNETVLKAQTLLSLI